jgi:hypothetical protein
MNLRKLFCLRFDIWKNRQLFVSENRRSSAFAWEYLTGCHSVRVSGNRLGIFNRLPLRKGGWQQIYHSHERSDCESD